MKKIISFALILIFLFSAIPVYANTDPTVVDETTPVEPDASVTEGCHTLDAKKGILGERQLITNCSAAFLYEYTTDTLMYSWNGDMRINPSSLVKIRPVMLAAFLNSLAFILLMSSP